VSKLRLLSAVVALAPTWAASSPAAATSYGRYEATVCQVAVAPAREDAQRLAVTVEGETWSRCVTGKQVAHYAVRVGRSSEGVCAVRQREFYAAQRSTVPTDIRPAWEVEPDDPWDAGPIYRWAGMGPCPSYEPAPPPGSVSPYAQTDPHLSDAAFLRIVRHMTGLGCARFEHGMAYAVAGDTGWPVRHIDEEVWLFGLLRTYKVSTRQVTVRGLSLRTRKYTLVDALGRIWPLRVWEPQVGP